MTDLAPIINRCLICRASIELEDEKDCATCANCDPICPTCLKALAGTLDKAASTRAVWE